VEVRSGRGRRSGWEKNVQKNRDGVHT